MAWHGVSIPVKTTAISGKNTGIGRQVSSRFVPQTSIPIGRLQIMLADQFGLTGF